MNNLQPNNKEITSAKKLHNDLLVPKLRFKEFDDEWVYKKLGKECNHISYGLTVRPKFEKKGIPLISAREITSGIVDTCKAPRININDFEKLSNKAKPIKGDIFLTKTGTIGFTARFNLDIPIAITQNIAVIRLNDTKYNDPLYLMQYFKTRKFYRTAISKVNQSTIMDLQLGDIRKLEIPFTSYIEQQKIATFLTAVDTKLQQLGQKKELLANYKKGVMQQLFSQQLRFKPDSNKTSVIANGSEAISNSNNEQTSLNKKTSFPDWEEKRLGEICDVRDGTHDSPKYKEVGFPLITSKNLMKDGSIDFENVNFISKIDFDNINKRSGVNNGDILFGMIGTIGNPVIVNESSFAIKNVALIKEKVLIKNTFLIQYLKSSLIQKQFYEQNTGGTQKFIALGVIRNLLILTPSLKEQQKIANYLSAIDKKIETVQTQIDKTQAFKKGLLQQMFV